MSDEVTLCAYCMGVAYTVCQKHGADVCPKHHDPFLTNPCTHPKDP